MATPSWHKFAIVRKLGGSAANSEEKSPQAHDDELVALEKSAEAWTVMADMYRAKLEASPIHQEPSLAAVAVQQRKTTQEEENAEKYVFATVSKLAAQQELRQARRRHGIKVEEDDDPNFSTAGMLRTIERLQVSGLPAKELVPGLIFQGSYRWLKSLKTKHPGLRVQHVVNCAWELDYGMLKAHGLHAKDVVMDCRLKDVEYERLQPMLSNVYESHILPLLSSKTPVYICCVAGRNRSAIVAAYVISRFLQITFQEALSRYVQRPMLELSQSFLDQCE